MYGTVWFFVNTADTGTQKEVTAQCSGSTMDASHKLVRLMVII